MTDTPIREQVREWSDKPTETDLAKIQDDTYDIGEKVVWMYQEDWDYLKKWADVEISKENWTRHAFYGGIVVPLDGTESHRSFDAYDMLNDVFICGTEYPTEKCNPDCEWFSLAQLICNKDLLYFGKVKPSAP